MLICATLLALFCRIPTFSQLLSWKIIRYGKLDATDDEVYAAARLANADTFIRQLPDGYNTVLTG